MALAVLYGQIEIATADDAPTTRELLAIITERATAERTRIDVQEKANSARFDAQEKAVLKAETAAEKRFDAVNEFRATLKDQQQQLITRNEVDIRFKSIDDKIAANTFQITQQVSRAEGVAQLWGVITVAVGLALTGMVALIALRKRRPE